MTNHHRRNWIFNKRTQNYEKTSNVLCYKIALGDYDYDSWARIQKKTKKNLDKPKSFGYILGIKETTTKELKMKINKNHNYFVQLCNCNSVLYSIEGEGYSSLDSILCDIKKEYGMKVVNGWKVFIRDNSVRDNEHNHPVYEYTIKSNRLVKG